MCKYSKRNLNTFVLWTVNRYSVENRNIAVHQCAMFVWRSKEEDGTTFPRLLGWLVTSQQQDGRRPSHRLLERVSRETGFHRRWYYGWHGKPTVLVIKTLPGFIFGEWVSKKYIAYVCKALTSDEFPRHSCQLSFLFPFSFIGFCFRVFLVLNCLRGLLDSMTFCMYKSFITEENSFLLGMHQPHVLCFFKTLQIVHITPQRYAVR